MSRIIASAAQRKCRNVFREAVAYAKILIADPVKKAEWQSRLRRPNSVYNRAIKEYMLEAKKQIQKQQEIEEVNKLIRAIFQPTPKRKERKICNEKRKEFLATHSSIHLFPPLNVAPDTS